MNVDLSKESINRLADALAPRVATIIMQRMKKDPTTEEWVDTKTAAAILGVQPGTLRKNAAKFTRVKSGEYKQGHVRYLRSELITSFAQ